MRLFQISRPRPGTERFGTSRKPQPLDKTRPWGVSENLEAAMPADLRVLYFSSAS